MAEAEELWSLARRLTKLYIRVVESTLRKCAFQSTGRDEVEGRETMRRGRSETLQGRFRRSSSSSKVFRLLVFELYGCTHARESSETSLCTRSEIPDVGISRSTAPCKCTAELPHRRTSQRPAPSVEWRHSAVVFIALCLFSILVECSSPGSHIKPRISKLSERRAPSELLLKA